MNDILWWSGPGGVPLLGEVCAGRDPSHPAGHTLPWPPHAALPSHPTLLTLYPLAEGSIFSGFLEGEREDGRRERKRDRRKTEGRVWKVDAGVMGVSPGAAGWGEAPHVTRSSGWGLTPPRLMVVHDTYTHAPPCTHIQTHSNIQLHASAQTQIYTHMHKQTHTYLPTHTLTHMDKYTHTHTQLSLSGCLYQFICLPLNTLH